MKKVNNMFLVLLVIALALFAIAKIFDLATNQSIVDMAKKIGLALIVLYVVSLVVSSLSKSK